MNMLKTLSDCALISQEQESEATGDTDSPKLDSEDWGEKLGWSPHPKSINIQFQFFLHRENQRPNSYKDHVWYS